MVRAPYRRNVDGRAGVVVGIRGGPAACGRPTQPLPVPPFPFRSLRALRVHTRFFASYRDLIGASTLSVDVPDGATVRDLVRTLRGRGGAFAALPHDPAVAVNLSYASPAEALADGDEVAFIPPVAGG